MAKAHEGLNLQPIHFDAIAKHLHDALADFDVDEKDIQTVLGSVSTLKGDILYK
jgi:hemoglobin